MIYIVDRPRPPSFLFGFNLVIAAIISLLETVSLVADYFNLYLLRFSLADSHHFGFHGVNSHSIIFSRYAESIHHSL